MVEKENDIKHLPSNWPFAQYLTPVSCVASPPQRDRQIDRQTHTHTHTLSHCLSQWGSLPLPCSSARVHTHAFWGHSHSIYFARPAVKIPPPGSLKIYSKLYSLTVWEPRSPKWTYWQGSRVGSFLWVPKDHPFWACLRPLLASSPWRSWLAGASLPPVSALPLSKPSHGLSSLCVSMFSYANTSHMVSCPP